MTGGFAALPRQAEEGNGAYGMQWKGHSGVRGPKWARMPLLTLGMLGLQVVWSVEMGYASPYLLSLGVSKALMSLVFLAGPLSGLIVQPLIGVLADRSKSRFGRRRPYIFAGAIICVLAMFILGFTRNIASVFTPAETNINQVVTIGLAILAIYCIDFSINAVQAADRALLVDVLPASEQELGNAWAGRMMGLGSVAGFFVGNVELHSILPFLGSTQLQVLSVITSIILLATHVATGLAVSEKVLVSSGAKDSESLTTALKDIWNNATKLPPTIRQICIIQFFSWIGWFPVLFFSPLFIGDRFKNSPAGQAANSIEELEEEAARLTSRALLWSSLLAFAASIVLPSFICHDRGQKRWFQLHLAELWSISQALFSLCMAATLFADNIGVAMALISVTGFCWAVTQWVPFSLLGEAILSEAVRDEDADIVMTSRRGNRSSHESGTREETDRLVPEDKEEHPVPPSPIRRRSATPPDDPNGRRLTSYRIPSESRAEGDDDDDYVGVSYADSAKDNIGDRAGIILGIHNAFVVMPQFLVTGLSSILFAIFEPGKSALPIHSPAARPANSTSPLSAALNGTALLFAREDTSHQAPPPGLDTTGLIFRIGGICAFVACILCWRLARTLKTR